MIAQGGSSPCQGDPKLNPNILYYNPHFGGRTPKRYPGKSHILQSGQGWETSWSCREIGARVYPQLAFLAPNPRVAGLSDMEISQSRGPFFWGSHSKDYTILIHLQHGKSAACRTSSQKFESAHENGWLSKL